MSIKVLTIINPTSGKGKILNKSDEIKKYLEEQKMDVDIKITKKDYNAKKIIENYDGSEDLILVCGGDGTLNETITAMMEKHLSDVSLSFIPLGTTNDLARTLNLPVKNIEMTKYLLQSKAKKIDVGRFNQKKYFCYVAAFGVMTDVSYRTSQRAKHIYGRLAYFANAFKELLKIPSYHIRIEYDGKIVEDEFIYGGISNSESIAGLRWFAKGEIQIDDGVLEGIFIRKPKTLLGYFKILGSFFQKDYHDNEYILFAQSNYFKIEAMEEISWTIDGEFAGRLKNVEISDCPKAIELAIPHNTKNRKD